MPLNLFAAQTNTVSLASPEDEVWDGVLGSEFYSPKSMDMYWQERSGYDWEKELELNNNKPVKIGEEVTVEESGDISFKINFGIGAGNYNIKNIDLKLQSKFETRYQNERKRHWLGSWRYRRFLEAEVSSEWQSGIYSIGRQDEYSNSDSYFVYEIEPEQFFFGDLKLIIEGCTYEFNHPYSVEIFDAPAVKTAPYFNLNTTGGAGSEYVADYQPPKLRLETNDGKPIDAYYPSDELSLSSLDLLNKTARNTEKFYFYPDYRTSNVTVHFEKSEDESYIQSSNESVFTRTGAIIQGSGYAGAGKAITGYAVYGENKSNGSKKTRTLIDIYRHSANGKLHLFGQSEPIGDGNVSLMSAQMKRAVQNAFSDGNTEVSAADRSYLSQRGEWNENNSINETPKSEMMKNRVFLTNLLGSGEPIDEDHPLDRLLQNGVMPGGQMDSAMLDEDTMFVVYIDDAGTDRGANDRSCAYYTYTNEDGSWQEPAAMEDDGTADSEPVIYDMGDRLLIAWLTADSTFDGAEDSLEAVRQSLNALNIHAVFFDKETKTFSKIDKVTQTTDEDLSAEGSITITSLGGGNVRIYYTKTQYRQNPADVNELIATDSVIAYRDCIGGSWSEEMTQEEKDNITASGSFANAVAGNGGSSVG